MELLQNEDRFGFMAVSLGYYDTLMSCPSASTSSELSPDEQQRAGIAPGLVRLSIGYTGSVEQRWRQLYDALETLEIVPPSRDALAADRPRPDRPGAEKGATAPERA
jgi:methionine-gamma-lyase